MVSSGAHEDGQEAASRLALEVELLQVKLLQESALKEGLVRAARELLADRRHVRHDGLAMALGDSLASVQQRRGLLRQELRHQTERREALERKREEAVGREHELKLALQHECATGLRQSWERMAAELQAREAAKMKALELEFQEACNSRNGLHKQEKEALLGQLSLLRDQLQHCRKQLRALRQQLPAADGQLRAEVAKGKEAHRRVSASLLEALAAWCRPMMLQDLASEEWIQALALRFASRSSEANVSLPQEAPSEHQEALERLEKELSLIEKQRGNKLRKREYKRKPASILMSLKIETVRARTKALVSEREHLESISGAEALASLQEELQNALKVHEQLRQDLDLLQLRSLQRQADAHVEEAPRPGTPTEDINSAGLKPLKHELLVVKSSCAAAHMENKALERERSLWKAHQELLQKLYEEEKEASRGARKAWELERAALREQIAAAEGRCEAEQPVEQEPSELLELEEVRRCLSAVKLALQHSHGASKAPKSAKEA